MTDSPRQLPLPLRLDDDATFDNFLTTPANSALVQHLQRASAGYTGSSTSGTVLSDFTWLTGPTGAGKSHLLQALCHQEATRGLNVFYLSLEDDVSLIRPDVLQGLELTDLLCIDDLDVVAGDNAWELALFHLYNLMTINGTRFVVSARTGPRQLTTGLSDLQSRWQSAAVFDITALDDGQKGAALQMRARARGLELGDEVVAFLMSRSGRDMNTLLQQLQVLDKHSLETKRRITVPMVKSLTGW